MYSNYIGLSALSTSPGHIAFQRRLNRLPTPHIRTASVFRRSPSRDAALGAVAAMRRPITLSASSPRATTVTTVSVSASRSLRASHEPRVVKLQIMLPFGSPSTSHGISISVTSSSERAINQTLLDFKSHLSFVGFFSKSCMPFRIHSTGIIDLYFDIFRSIGLSNRHFRAIVFNNTHFRTILLDPGAFQSPRTLRPTLRGRQVGTPRPQDQKPVKLSVSLHPLASC
jgi:hypothetical protein